MRHTNAGTLLTLLCLALALPLAAASNSLEVKDPTPMGFLPPPAALTGGPDGFGYTFADSAEVSCGYQFIDIATTGEVIVVGDDTASGAYLLAMPFNFYGAVYNDIIMAANGYLTLTNDAGCLAADTGGDLSNDCPLPDDPSTPSACRGLGGRIYPLHDDLDLESGIGQGYVEYFSACPRDNPNCPDDDCTVFQWDNVAHYPGGASAPTWNMQAILYHQSGDIVVQIGAGNPELGSSSTTGIMDATNTDALQYACNTLNSIPDNLGVCFTHPLPASSCSQGGGGGGGNGGGEKQLLCHVPPGNPENAHIIEVGVPAVDAHMTNHGDCMLSSGSKGDPCSCQ